MTDTNEQRRGLITREDARRQEREHERKTYDINREHAQRAHDRNSEFFYTANAAATKAAEVAIKAGLLMNGGSSVAMLAFIGTLASKDQLAAQQINLLAEPLICFAFGVLATVVGSCLTYFTSLAVAGFASSRLTIWEHPYIKDGPDTKRYRITAELVRWLAIISMAVSVGCFIAGVFSAKSAFEQLPQHAGTTPSGKTP